MWREKDCDLQEVHAVPRAEDLMGHTRKVQPCWKGYQLGSRPTTVPGPPSTGVWHRANNPIL